MQPSYARLPLRPRKDLRPDHTAFDITDALLTAAAPSLFPAFGALSSRLTYPLCTLHLAGHPTRRNTRFRVAVNLPGWDFNPRGCFEIFYDSTDSFYTSQAWPGAPGIQGLCVYISFY